MILKWVSGDRIDFDGIILDEIKKFPQLGSERNHFVGMTAISHFVQHIKSL